MRRVLITGITGYAGSHLARDLLPSHDVYGLVREPLHGSYIADFQEQVHLLTVDGSYAGMEAAIREAQPDLVYHLAAYYTGAHGPEVTPELIASNITFGAYLLEAMSACGCPALVYASTVMAHYAGEAYRPLNLYAATKQAFSDLLDYYTDAGLMRAVTLVLSDTYGPDDRRPKVLNLIRSAALNGETIALSDGGQDYDVVHINDVVRAFRMAGELLIQRNGRNNEVFQVCADKPLTLRQTVEQMLKSNDLPMETASWGQRPNADREIQKAIRLYPTLPGWSPQVDLETGLCLGGTALSHLRSSPLCCRCPGTRP